MSPSYPDLKKKKKLNPEELNKEWPKVKKEYEDAERKGLKFDYKKHKIVRAGDLIVEALAFWRFVDRHLPKDDWPTRRAFLKQFIDHTNGYVSIVAYIESLPTSVWRKILWKGNIDFMSFESFLRRLKPEQIEMIKDNYRDLMEHRLPRVFSKNGCKLKRISVDRLMAEDYWNAKRNINKAAWTRNALSLDMGFNAYPEGLADDTELIEQKPLNFTTLKRLAKKFTAVKKDHADDFVVNQEDGRYYRFYRSARSNAAHNPGKEIQVKTHICPGFWYTLLMHGWFWILSPLLCLILLRQTAGPSRARHEK